MRIYGQLVKARLQNIAGAVAASVKGLIYYRTDNDRVYVDDSAAQQEVQQRQHLITNFRTDGPSTTGKAQLALCNNAANNGYEYSNAVISGTKATILALPREAKLIYFATDEGLYYGDDGVNLVSLGGSGSGGINFIENGTADVDVAGWSGYTDAAGTEPVNGTGLAVPLTVTLTRITTDPMNGAGHFRFSKPASNCQGQGWSYDFTIQKGYLPAVIRNMMVYLTSANFVDGDVRFFLYNVTQSKLIRVDRENLDATSYPNNYLSSWQSDAATVEEDYRLIIHVATTSALAYDIDFDDVIVGPKEASRGSLKTDWKTLTGFTGSWVSNTTYSALYTQDGDSYEVALNVSTSGAPTATDLTVNLPFTIDSSKLLETTSGELWIGSGAIIDTTNLYLPVNVFRVSDTQITFRPVRHSVGTYSDHNNPVTSTVPFTFGAGDSVNVVFKVPVVGKSSSQVVSEDHGQRLIVCSMHNQVQQNYVSIGPHKVTFDTLIQDTVGGVDLANDRINIKESGTYTVSFAALIDNVAIDESGFAMLYKNGSVLVRSYMSGAANTGLNAPCTIPLPLVAGDYLELYVQVSADTSWLVNRNIGVIETFISVTKIAGNQQIAASEIVEASYRTNSGQAVVSANIIIYEDQTAGLDVDTHKIMNTGTGRITIPANGTYEIFWCNTTANLSAAIGNLFNTQLMKNASVIGYGTYDLCQNTSSRPYQSTGSHKFQAAKGDLIDIRFNEDIPATNLNTSEFLNFMWIKKSGGIA
jgi:hypothetical protein